MSAQLQSATSQPNVSALPDAWIIRIFDHMAALYGSKFADLWRGTDAEKVKGMWSQRLSGFSSQPACIKAALDALDERPFPPTLPEFIQLCRDAGRRFGTEQKALPHNPTPEEMERAKAAAREAARIARGDRRENLDWARHPKSQLACTAVFDGAKRDGRLREIRDDMVRDGVASESGSLLKRWDGTQWVKP